MGTSRLEELEQLHVKSISEHSQHLDIAASLLGSVKSWVCLGARLKYRHACSGPQGFQI